MMYQHLSAPEQHQLNSNIGCFEIQNAMLQAVLSNSLNSNIGCFEIFSSRWCIKHN